MNSPFQGRALERAEHRRACQVVPVIRDAPNVADVWAVAVVTTKADGPVEALAPASARVPVPANDTVVRAATGTAVTVVRNGSQVPDAMNARDAPVEIRVAEGPFCPNDRIHPVAACMTTH